MCNTKNGKIRFQLSNYRFALSFETDGLFREKMRSSQRLECQQIDTRPSWNQSLEYEFQSPTFALEGQMCWQFSFISLVLNFLALELKEFHNFFDNNFNMAILLSFNTKYGYHMVACFYIIMHDSGFKSGPSKEHSWFTPKSTHTPFEEMDALLVGQYESRWKTNSLLVFEDTFLLNKQY